MDLKMHLFLPKKLCEMDVEPKFREKRTSRKKN